MTTKGGQTDAERHILDTPAAGPAAIRGSTLRAGAYAAGILLSLAASPLLIRHLGQAGYGRYFTVVSLIAIVAGLTEGGLNTIAVREYSTVEGPARAELMANLFGMRLALSSAGGAVAVVFAVLAGYDRPLVLGTVVAALGMVLQLAQTMLVVPLQSSLRFGWAAAIEVLRQLVSVLLIVGLVVMGATVVPFLAVPIPACLVALVATAVLVRHLTPLRPRFDLARWRPLLADTGTYAVAIALNALYFRVTVVIMSLISTGLQTGYFSTSFRVVEVVIGLPALVIGSAFPILSRAAAGDARRFGYATGRLFEIAVVVGTWIVVCIVVGSDFAVRVLGGPSAAPAAPVLRIQALALLASFVTLACGFPLLSLRRHRELLIANVAALCASVALTLALAPAMAARGAAIAAVAAEALLATITAVMLARADRSVRLPLSIFAVASVAAGCALAVGVLLHVHPIIGTALASIVYFAVIGAFGRFPPEVRHGFGPDQWRLTLRSSPPPT